MLVLTVPTTFRFDEHRFPFKCAAGGDLCFKCIDFNRIEISLEQGEVREFRTHNRLHGQLRQFVRDLPDERVVAVRDDWHHDGEIGSKLWQMMHEIIQTSRTRKVKTATIR